MPTYPVSSRSWLTTPAIAALLLSSAIACIGEIGGTPSDAPSSSASSALLGPGAFGKIGMRRLTRFELANTLTDVFGVDPGKLMDLVPADIRQENDNPFDNDYVLQDVSTNYVQSLNTFAESYADMVVSDPARVEALAGCVPVTVDDGACFGALVERTGRLAFRRPISDAEVTRLAALLEYAQEESSFAAAAALLVRFFVQHPEMLYRIETGRRVSATPAGELFELDGFQIAARMSYLLWGSAPDEDLLAAAEAGELGVSDGRLAHAQRMMDDPRARRQIRHFHAQWLGFSELQPDVLEADLRQETDALIDYVTRQSGGPWLDLFQLDRSYVTPALATHYGMSSIPAAPGWVDYDGARGGGILAHGLFLQQGSKFGDTSPTLRGYRISKRILCQPLPLDEIPSDVDTDMPPSGASASDCKPQRYTMRSKPACSTCHTILDGIGFGLENFGALGEWRTTEPGLPACTIDGAGELQGEAFSGPAELGALFASGGEVASCASRQLFRFALGRTDDGTDAATLETLGTLMSDTPGFADLLFAFVESPAIAHRVREVP